jgi:Tol biopolymer transport system component
MGDFQEKLNSIKTLRAQRNAVDQQLYQTQLDLQKLERQLRRQAQQSENKQSLNDDTWPVYKEQLAKLGQQLREAI